MRSPAPAAIGLGLAAVVALCAPEASAAARPAPRATGLPYCDEATGPEDTSTGRWRFVGHDQQGVEGAATEDRHWVGVAPATDGFHRWAPFDEVKTTICGQLADFGTFEPTHESPLLQMLPELPEHDWNMIIVPTPATVFDERFKLAGALLERGHEGDIESCPDRQHPCFEAEITPDRRLLKANAAERWLDGRRGQTLCAFGPWVGDGGHGFRPELHPAERIWWREPGDVLRLFAAQDASKRFGDRRSFVWSWREHEGKDKHWHPWAGPRMGGEFRVAFEMREDSTVRFEIDQVMSRNARRLEPSMRPSPYPAPSPGAVSSVFTFPLTGEDDARLGAIEVRLRVSPKGDMVALDTSRLSVRPWGVCRRRGQGEIQGYLAIADRLGYAQEEGEGYNVFEVKPPPLLHPVPSPCPLPEPPAAPAPNPATLTAFVQITARDRQPQHVGPPAPVNSLLNDLLRATEVQLPETVRAALALRSPRLTLGVNRHFSLTARPHYDGPRGDRINAVIGKLDPRRADHERWVKALRQLLAAAHGAESPVPERVTWTIEAVDVTTGATLPVVPAPASARAPRVERTLTSSLLRDDTCDLDLRGVADSDVIRVKATASILTETGESLRQTAVPNRPAVEVEPRTVRLGSHFISAVRQRGADEVLEWLARSFGGDALVRDAQVQGPLPPPLYESVYCDPLDPYRRANRARMLRAGLVLATQDRRITLDELAQFVRMARDYASPPPLHALMPAPTTK